MNRHLVAVEISIIRGAGQGMEFQRPSFRQHRLEGLNPQAMQRRRAVQKHRMFFDDFFQNIPDLRLNALYHTFGRLNIADDAVINKLLHDKGLKELQRHFLRQTALMQLQLRSDDDNRTSRIVDALSQQILPETPLLAFKHIGQRFQRTIARTGDRSTTATVINQSVDGFLKHTFFIADDNIRRAEI